MKILLSSILPPFMAMLWYISISAPSSKSFKLASTLATAPLPPCRFSDAFSVPARSHSFPTSTSTTNPTNLLGTKSASGMPSLGTIAPSHLFSARSGEVETQLNDVLHSRGPSLAANDFEERGISSSVSLKPASEVRVLLQKAKEFARRYLSPSERKGLQEKVAETKRLGGSRAQIRTVVLRYLGRVLDPKRKAQIEMDMQQLQRDFGGDLVVVG